MASSPGLPIAAGGCKKFARAVKVGARLSKGFEVACALQKGGDLSHDRVEKVRGGGSAKSGRCYYILHYCV